MKLRLLLAALAATFFTASLHAQPADYPQLKAEAEKLFAEKSFAKAREAYAKIVTTNLPPAEQRWVQFRLADTQWRSEASTQRADTTKLDAARDALDKMVRDIQRTEEKDRVWVEVQESLGDFWWTRRDQMNWGAAWPFYQAALDWWAGQSVSDEARQRYLDIVWRTAKPPLAEPYYRYGNYGNVLPRAILENVLKIAVTENDQAHANYLLAASFQHHGGDWDVRARIPEHFEAALKPGKGTDWYGDALYQYAEWMMNQGRAVPLKDGNWRQEPDFVKALELFRRLTREFTKGESRYFEQAQAQIKNITDEQVGVSVSHFFLPDSEVQYHLNWRNVGRIDLALYAVDLAADVNLGRQDDNRRPSWLQTIDLAGRAKVKEWSHDTQDKKDYRPGNASLRLEQKLAPGAYVLEARGGGKSAREIVLVTDFAVVLKTSGKQALIYFCNALNSSPQREGKVKLWERWNDGNRWQARESEKEVNADGIAVFDLGERANRGLELFAAAKSADRQAFSTGNSYWGRADREQWKIYAFTDRPAYRPKETVQWKFIARRYNGSVYSTPSDTTIEFEITDPRGAKVKADKAKLNTFGSAWGALELTEAMPLGEYQIQFWNEDRKQHIGNAQLFRLEEYKLPEFKVTVQTPEEKTADDKTQRKAFRLGETVEVSVQADYYFGGAVANASVEVLVYQDPFWRTWRRERDFPWFYDDMDENANRSGRWGRGGGGGQVIKRETLKTDATGKATLTFDTPKGGGQDFEYRVEARVTDASRREITGNGTVRVTQQRYYVFARPDHNLYRPQDKVRVEFKASDANDQPVVAEGIVKLLREYWWEIWIAPDGREVKGDELKKLQAEKKIWPPAPERPDQKDWRLKFRGYERDEIKTLTVKTDAEGKGEFTFTPEREGYYRVTWLSEDVAPKRPPQPIRAETTVWVANNASTEIGYRHGGVEIIADQDTFRVGQRAPVMLVTPTADRYVLFTTEAEELMSYQLVHVTGTVKLVELDIAEQHVPNFFLGAALVTDRQIFTDTKQVVVPPTKNFLSVDVKPDRAQYQPREDGSFVVTTRDHAGKPVSAEVAFALFDESISYIQSDYAGDIRQFFYGTKRPQQTQLTATMNQKSFAKLLKGEKDELFDEREADETGKRRRLAGNRNESDRFYNDLNRSSLVEDERRKDQFGFTGGASVAMDYAAAPMETATATSSLAFGGMVQMRGAMPASAPMAAGRLLEKQSADKKGGTGDEPAVVVRSDFRSTILWQPDVKTDADGTATVKVKYPDSLTGWKASARAVSAGNQFGLVSTNTRTKQPLIVRLQSPRFFVVGDLALVSAVINNNTDHPLQVSSELDAEGLVISGIGIKDGMVVKGMRAGTVTVPANGEVREDWAVFVKNPGPVKLKVTGRGGKYSDAMEKSYIAHEHGIEKFLTKAGKVRGNDITVKLDIPKARKPESTSLAVQVTPSLAVTMLDALPYLIDYPYGCTEQTMSRFLPAAITAKTLRDLGLAPEDVMSRVFGGIEPANVKATQPKGKKDLAKLDEMVKAGLERLYDFQHGDGGWGWWKPGDSDHWMTAYVVWGLTLAKQAGVEIKGNVLERGAAFLEKTLVEEELNPDMQAWMLHARAVYKAARNEAGLSNFEKKAFDNLWNDREKLNAYTRALFALSAHHFGKAAEAKTLIENLENGVKRDERPDASVLIGGAAPANKGVMGTAHWGEDGVYWRWSDGGVEATAFALRALLTIDPKNPLIEPVTNWLIKNRRGAQWSNTRDTAIVVLAMNDYLKVSGELKPELEFSVFVNGTKIADRKVSGADVFNAPSRFTVDPKLIKDGANEIRIKRKGDGAVYFAAEAKFFSLEEPITPAGNEIFVKREYYKLVGRPTLLKGFVYDRVPLKDGESVKSGERIETVLTVETKNNYEYLLFEDLKPAGFEAVEIRSGESLYAREMKSGAVERKFSGQKSEVRSQPKAKVVGGAARRIASIAPVGLPRPMPMSDTDFTGRSRWVYQELRDRKVALFVDKLPEGVWEIRYDFRAEVPGKFHALPVLGHAMYVPEIRCNGAEVRVTVEDAKP